MQTEITQTIEPNGVLTRPEVDDRITERHLISHTPHSGKSKQACRCLGSPQPNEPWQHEWQDKQAKKRQKELRSGEAHWHCFAFIRSIRPEYPGQEMVLMIFSKRIRMFFAYRLDA
jgi:hypothetical protein